MATETLACTGVGTHDEWDLTSGASKAAAVALPDDADTTHITGSPAAEQDLAFEAPSEIGEGDTINSVAWVVRVKSTGMSPAELTVHLNDGSEAGTKGADVISDIGAGYADETQTHGTNWNEEPWAFADLANLELHLLQENAFGSELKVTTAYLIVDYTPAPESGGGGKRLGTKVGSGL